MNKVTITNQRSVEPLNIPSNWDEINIKSISKFASTGKSFEERVSGMDLGGFDILQAVKDNPDHLFVKVFAIKKDEVNDNGDYFSEDELKKAAKTFIGVPVFVNHQNDDIEKARGKVVHAWWDSDRGGIYTINMVDKVAYPRLARGIEAGYVTGSSMGCSVKFSCCSICHNRAANAKEYCSHIKERKKKNYNGEQECQYHKSSGSGKEPCPVCGCEKGDKKMHKHAGTMVFEHNFGVKFIEDSFVVNPACHDCLVSDVINPSGLLKKVANLRETINKISANVENEQAFGFECSTGSCSLHKAAGKQEIGELNYAMNQLERVARSMMAQKNKVSLEYVSDIIKVTADIQKISDELVEMGYAGLPSPTESQIAFGTNVAASPTSPATPATQVPVTAMPQPSYAPQASTQPSFSRNVSPMLKNIPSGNINPVISDLGDDIGRVTKPSFVPVSANSIKDFVKISNSIQNRLSSLMSAMYLNGESMKEKSAYKYSEGDDSIVIQSDSDGEIHVAYLVGDRLLKWASADTFSEEINTLIHNDPESAASMILSSFKNVNNSDHINIEESKLAMENNKINKVAQARANAETDVVTEAQLNSVKGIHSRKGDSYSATTESSEQLGAKKSYSDVGGTSATPRQDSPYETIIEETLNSKKGGYMARWGSFPEVVTEAQWTDASREVFANIPGDWTSVSQGAQLDMLRKTFSWNEPNVTTEAQLGGVKSKTASAQELIKQAQSALADAMAFYGIGVDDIKNSIKFINSDFSRQNKAKCLAAINAAPWAVSARQVNNNRLASFSKVASEVYGIEPIDALLAAIGDNMGKSSAGDLIDAVSFVANNKVAMQQVEEIAVEKVENASFEDSSNEEIFRKAFSEMSLPEDGMIKVCMSAEDDLGMEVSSDKSFVDAVHKYAQSVVNDNFGKEVDIVPVAVDVDEENGLVEATCKLASHLTKEEKSAFEKWASSEELNIEEDSYEIADYNGAENNASEKRASLLRELDSLEKKAQLAGGQMPAGLNPAGMGMGAQLPGGAPPAGAPGVEALTTGGAADPAMAGMDPAAAGADPLAGGDVGMEEETKAKPPAAVCVVCGNNDVDVQGGKSKCNGPGCGLGYTIKIVPDATLLDKISDGDIDQEDATEEPGAESPEKGLGGMSSAPAEGAVPGAMPGGMAVAASTRITPDIMRKFASNGSLGSISPITGTRNTIQIDNENWQCLDSGQVYKVRLAASTKSPKEVWAQWEWEPVMKSANCSPCRRRKNAIIRALSSIGVSEDQFDGMSMLDKAAALSKINASGLLRNIKEASSQNVSVRDSIKQAFSVRGEFPMNTCLEKLARRYGENALALSGPCEGQNLANCVCGSLAEEGVYTTNLATKVASAWASRDPMMECVEDYIREGLSLSKSAQACEDLKSKYITSEEVFADEITESYVKSAQEEEVFEGEENPFDSEDSEDSDGGEEVDLTFNFDENDLTDADDESMFDGAEEDSDDEGFDLEISDDDMGDDDMGDDDMGDDDMGDDDMGDDDMGDDDMGGDDMGDDDIGDDDMGDDDMGDDDMGDDMGNLNKEEVTMEKENEMVKQSPESKLAQIYSEAESLKRGRIVGVNKLNIDINSIKRALHKEASDKKLSPISAQDTVKGVANGKPHADSTQEGFDAETPEVPTSGEGMKDLDLPSIPAGGGKFKGEENYDAEMQENITGGQSGQGAEHTGKYRKSAFEKALSKLATKLNRVNVQDDKDIGPIGKEDPGDAFEVPTNGGKPLSSETNEGFDVDGPDVPTGSAEMGQEKELGYTAEKQTEMTGGNAGAGSVESVGKYKGKKANENGNEVAIKLAGRMLEAGLIKSEQLSAKLAELKRYEVSQLRDLEKAMFTKSNFNKGLKVASSGVEQPLVISEVSSQKNASTDLKSKIASLFRLQQQVELAQESEATKLRAFK